MKVSEMNKNEKAAFMQVVNATDWILGGYENELSDSGTAIPEHEILKNEIYDTVMNCSTYPGTQAYYPIKEIRFASTAWINERIEKRLAKMGY